MDDLNVRSDIAIIESELYQLAQHAFLVEGNCDENSQLALKSNHNFDPERPRKLEYGDHTRIIVSFQSTPSLVTTFEMTDDERLDSRMNIDKFVRLLAQEIKPGNYNNDIIKEVFSNVFTGVVASVVTKLKQDNPSVGDKEDNIIFQAFGAMIAIALSDPRDVWIEFTEQMIDNDPDQVIQFCYIKAVRPRNAH